MMMMMIVERVNQGVLLLLGDVFYHYQLSYHMEIKPLCPKMVF